MLCALRLPARAPRLPDSGEPSATRVTIQSVESGVPLAAARALMAAHRRGVALLYADAPAVAAEYCPAEAYAAELAALPGDFAAPGGGLWLARVEGRAAGVVGLRPLPSQARTAELKRLYVPRFFRRLGLARALVKAAVERARETGLARLVLESGDRQRAAHALYEDLGFRPIPAYRHHSPPLQAHLRFFELRLD